ncbi:sodium:proton antiporter [Eggerthella sp. YY7918]|uniref:sodium:proton antiporter n=1 Tax=Eggerthella sp. (strain YY7918) TaxID=502558 RepID=UPI0002171550|nr:Na+/H+ antiporter NhaD [Eggerthella sp. YY7918]
MFSLTTAQIISIVVFVVVMTVVISEKVHRATAALAGAVVLLVLGIVSFDTGMEHIDFNTLGVLVGMMMFVAVVKYSGIFEYLAVKSAKLAKGNPWVVMILFSLITAVLSAFLDNVTTVLLIGPVTLTVCRMLDINPIPFFITEIIASNVGGTATLIGDPPNIMIGSAAGLSFFDFLMFDGPAVLVMLALCIGIFYVLYGRKMHVGEKEKAAVMTLDETASISDPKLFKKSVIMIVLVAIAFIAHGAFHIEPSVIALGAAAVMLLISRTDIEKIINDVEWTTIGFFAGLFIVVGGMAETGVIEMMAHGLIDLTGGNLLITIVVLVWASAILSSFLDNIPLVATLIPIISTMQSSGVDVAPLWWAISLGACVGGIGTLIGASANVVLASISTRNGHTITFMEYTKIGFPIMIVLTAVSCVYLILRFCVFV